jgi:hypothetical protein
MTMMKQQADQDDRGLYDEIYIIILCHIHDKDDNPVQIQHSLPFYWKLATRDESGLVPRSSKANRLMHKAETG